MKRLERIAVVLLLLVAGQLYAQPTQPTSPPPASVAEIQARVAEAEAQVKLEERKVLALQALARKEKDVIKLTCVNDKMVQLKAQANLFDQSRAELAAVIETDARDAAFRTMTEVVEQIRKLREEAEGCVGQPELTSEFAADFTAPTIIDDPTGGVPFEDNDTVVEPPAYASPFN